MTDEKQPLHVIEWAGDDHDEVINRYAHERGWKYATNSAWQTVVTELPIPAADMLKQFAALDRKSHNYYFTFGDEFVVNAQLGQGAIRWRANGATSDFSKLVQWLEAEAPKMPPASELGWRPVRFWFITPKGPKSIARRLKIVKWPDIRINYASDIREMMDTIIAPEWRPSGDGKLVLWRGAPGTGKTYAIRSLMESWGVWADFNYIVDPDAFFGGNPEYLMTVVNGAEDDDDLGITITDDGEIKKDDRWTVIVLEDAGELMTADAKERAGQALSRLLNVVDGFIGQGLKVLLLITTNEDIAKLHPAVSRPGRCVFNTEFKELTHAEALEWAKAKGIEQVPASGRLADLYAALRGKKVDSKQAVGFTS